MKKSSEQVNPLILLGANFPNVCQLLCCCYLYREPSISLLYWPYLGSIYQVYTMYIFMFFTKKTAPLEVGNQKNPLIYLAFYLAYLLAYVLAYLLAYLLAFYLANLLAFYLAYLLAFYLAYLLAFYLAYLLAFYLAVEVRQCPLGSGSRGWGPAVPTAIWKSRLRSGSAHCNLEVAVEVRQCPLRSGARGGGPAVPTWIWSSRWTSGSAHWDLELAVEVRLCPLGSGLRGGGRGGDGGGGGGGGGEQLW